MWGEIYDSMRFAILSMSRRYKDIGIRLRSQSENIVDHLMKLYFFRDSQWRRAWVVHVFKAVSWIDTRKGSGGLPERDWIYDCLWGESEDRWFATYKSRISGLVAEMGETYLDMSVVLDNPRPKELHDFVQCYMLWLSRRLSEAGSVTFEETFNEVDSLLEDFPFRS